VLRRTRKLRLTSRDRKRKPEYHAGKLGAVTLLVTMMLSTTTAMMPQTAKEQSISTQELKEKAGAAREQGDSQASLKLYERALARSPSWQEGWWYYGSLLYDADSYGRAAAAFGKLVQLNDKLGNAWSMLGLSEFEVHDYDKALNDLQNAERIGPGESLQNIADYHLAVLLNQHGDSDGALLLLSSLYVKGVRSEDLQVALGLALLRVPIFPSQLDPSRDALIHDAGSLAALMANKQIEKADISFREMLLQYPKVQFLHYAYGGMLASEGHDAEAEAQFKAETDMNPDSAVAYLEWSFLCMKAKDYPEAARLARHAAELNEESFLAHYILGNSLLSSGDPKAARPELEMAEKLAPGAPDIRYSLSRTYARLGEDALAKREQAEFLTLQRKNAMDRLELQKRFPGAPAITGIRPITPQ
jgi:tetratricopeptide (TPR) repeat protein